MTSTLYGKEHIDRYRETEGEDGYRWRNDTTILILTTTGRRSGKQRDHALIYRDYGDAYLIVASKGGADEAPEWYQNLEANPNVQVQIKGERFAARARTATPEEKPEMWAVMVDAWPDYQNYQTKTTREIPVVVLERV